MTSNPKTLTESLRNSVHKVITEYEDEQLLAVQMTKSNLEMVIKLLELEVKLTGFIDNDEAGELGHWIAAPMKDVGTFEQFHDVVERAEKVITLLREREKAARINLDLASDTIKRLKDDAGKKQALRKMQRYAL